MQRNAKDKAIKTEQEYFIPCYGGEAKVVWATSAEEAERKLTKGETEHAPLVDEVITNDHE